MTREDKDSLVEMLSKIPITETRGSLLSAIGKLLRVIDISENSIMIPTLLKDKCEFDAYEMLTLAKILKASILGHNDLVEFYMSESSSQLNSLAQQQHKQNSQYQLQLQSATPSLRSSISESTSSSTSIHHHQHHQQQQSMLPYTNQLYSHPYNHNHLLLQQTSLPNHHPHHNHHHLHHLDSTTINNHPLQLTNGDSDATMRLLLQIEQLKTFIPQVTGLFESIIELYKNSVDTITKLTS